MDMTQRTAPQFFFVRLVLISGLLFAMPLVALAQYNDELDYDAILEQLEELTELREQRVIDSAKSAYNVIKAASTSQTESLKLFYDAVLKIKYSGQTRENSQLREWKKKNDDQFEDRYFREGLRLHLVYLALSIRRAQAPPDDESTFNDLKSFADSVLNMEPEMRNEGEWMKKSIASSEIARAYNLDSYLPEEDGWELVPGNADGMYEKTILPKLRLQKSPQILAYWDNRISRLRAEIEEVDRTFQQENILNNQLPKLYWERANELHVLGQSSKAVKEKLAIIRNYPDNDNFERWVSDLQADVLAMKSGEMVAAVASAQGIEPEGTQPAKRRTADN